MQKHPNITAGKPQVGHCPFTTQVIMQPVQVSQYAFQRHICKQALCKPIGNYKVYKLPCGCYVWVHSSGIRQLSAFPF
ncbi:MAG: hypothetical protein ACXVA2_24370 [Mucilaginibacter sp.]